VTTAPFGILTGFCIDGVSRSTSGYSAADTALESLPHATNASATRPVPTAPTPESTLRLPVTPGPIDGECVLLKSIGDKERLTRVRSSPR
jgi:hypothetical protein